MTYPAHERAVPAPASRLAGDLPPEEKQAPADRRTRDLVRQAAANRAETLDRQRPLRREELAALAEEALASLGLGREYLGFAMVAVDNAFWRGQFASVPAGRRLLMLPHCLSAKALCAGRMTEDGLECAGCGACALDQLRREAESLGYDVLIAEGTPPVVRELLSGRAEAVLGVACLDSLEKAFRRVSEVGIPHAAVPLLRDGCADTLVDADEVRDWLRLERDGGTPATRAYYPLLRHAVRLCDDAMLRRLLDPFVQGAWRAPEESGPPPQVEAIAVDWLRRGGKRFRPFLTLAAYAAMKGAAGAMRAGADLDALLPDSARRVALGFEALHKASLAHDDVEDGDLYRYGAETLHRKHGVPTAINSGDYLVGLGYRLALAGALEEGADCAADVMLALTEAHLALSRGQGMELLWRERGRGPLEPIEVLTIYALKTAPAFRVALYAGMRLAGPCGFGADLRDFCRRLGVAYQIENDLKDWREENHDKVVVGQDALASRPTILQAFADQAMSEEERRRLAEAARPEAPQASALAAVRAAYESAGAFEKAAALRDLEAEKARASAMRVESEGLRELLLFVLDVML